MVAFRKLFPAFAVVALLVGATSAAGQQQQLQCTANAGVPPVVRAEGYTELAGDLVLTCTGGNPAQEFLANFQVTLNTNITSRLIGDGLSEALLMIDEPGAERAAGPVTPFCVSPGPSSNSDQAATCNPAAGGTYQEDTYNVFKAQRGAANNQLVWNGVPVVPPGTNTRVFRFTNVRANAAGLGASQTLIPTQIVAFVSVSPSGSLPINNPQQVVGYVQQGLVFDVTNCSGGSLSTNFNQCENLNADFFNDPVREGSFAASAAVRFREGFATAFKRRIQRPDESSQQQFESLPGQVFNTESGFVRTDISALDRVGIADTGTRLSARFVNIPANVRLFAGTTGTSTTGQAVLVSTDAAGSSGAGGFLGADPSPQFTQTELTCGSTTVDAVEIPVTAGTGVAVWEVTEANQSAIDDIRFVIGIAYRANVSAGAPALGAGQVIGNFAPFYPAGAAETMSSGLPIPRFAARADANNLFRIAACVTNLLFPFVTNQEGFDTGLAIANTSEDPFSGAAGRAQGGTCTLNYYGSLPNGNEPTRTSEESEAIEAGQHAAMVLSSGGTFGLQGNPNFQGYIIAQCNFRYAHGFAFITDGPIGQARVAEGYLALVLDEPSGNRTGSTGEGRGH